MKGLHLLLVAATLCGLSQAYVDKTVSEYLQLNGYSKLVKYLTQAGLLGQLSGPGPFTIFAPTDAAFAKLNASTLASFTSSASQIKKVLSYHVIEDFVLNPMITKQTTKMTLEGQEMELNTAGTGALAHILVNGVGSVLSRAETVVNNGVVQQIDTVLFPPTSGGLNIAQILLLDDARFIDLYLALQILDLTAVLEVPGSEFTLFAPVNNAFLTFNDSKLNFDRSNGSMVHKELFKYHVVPGAHYIKNIRPHVPMYTLHGRPLTVTQSSAGLMVDGAHIVESDIAATNGVIHVVDSILTPLDILRP